MCLQPLIQIQIAYPASLPTRQAGGTLCAGARRGSISGCDPQTFAIHCLLPTPTQERHSSRRSAPFGSGRQGCGISACHHSGTCPHAVAQECVGSRLARDMAEGEGECRINSRKGRPLRRQDSHLCRGQRTEFTSVLPEEQDTRKGVRERLPQGASLHNHRS